MDNLISTGEQILQLFQQLGKISTAIGFSIGALYLILGGDTGRQKARGWFIGGAVGLVVLMSAYGIAQNIDNSISF